MPEPRRLGEPPTRRGSRRPPTADGPRAGTPEADPPDPARGGAQATSDLDVVPVEKGSPQRTLLQASRQRGRRELRQPIPLLGEQGEATLDQSILKTPPHLPVPLEPGLQALVLHDGQAFVKSVHHVDRSGVVVLALGALTHVVREKSCVEVPALTGLPTRTHPFDGPR
jgi:hypothetical protein